MPLQVQAELHVSAGRVVRRRLARDAPARVVSDDPFALGAAYARDGAARLLLVDVDGAVDGTPQALELAGRLAAEAGVPVAYRGGLRSAADIDRAREAGVDRVVLDAAAFGDAAVLRWAVDRLGERLAVALDAEGDRVRLPAGHSGPLDLADAAGELAYRGVAGFLHTDVGRAGTHAGPQLEVLARLLDAVDAQVVYAGGVGSADDVRRLAGLRRANLTAVSIASALYDGRLTVAEARAAAADPISQEDA